MMFWDDDDDVASFAYETNAYVLADGKKTIPDFDVYYKNGQHIVYEIKPSGILGLPQVKNKIDLTMSVLKNMGLKYVILEDVDIKAYKLSLGEKFTNEINKYKNRRKKI